MLFSMACLLYLSLMQTAVLISLIGFLAGRNGTQDLRTKLARQPPKGGFQGRGSGVVDLREKLSGSVSHPPPLSQVNEAAKRRVASVVYNSSNVTQGVASTTVPAPVQARQKPTAKANVDVSLTVYSK